MQLWFFVEGEKDEDFVRRVIEPYLRSRFAVLVWRFGRRTKQKRSEFIKSLHSPNFKDADYWILADQDLQPCFTACREFVAELFDGVPSPDKIICPHRSIEAWYVAGFTQSKLFPKLRFGIAEGMHKRDFERIIQECGYKLSQRSEIMAEMLEGYDLAQARKRSDSLDYFCRKLGI